MSRMPGLRNLVAALVVGLATASCAHGGGSAGSRDVDLTSARTRRDAETDKRTPVSQAELQESIQRFTGNFTDRMTQAMGDLARNGSPAMSDDALRRALLYASSALDIATGPLAR